MAIPERRSDGFRERGDKVTRLETFVDAAFAFAVTLLVIAGDGVPGSIADLLVALEDVPAFAAAFALIALFWSAHDTWSRRYGLTDQVTTLLSLALVFLVLIYVYPLRMLFESFFTWVTQGRLGDGAGIQTSDDLRAMFVAYGICLITVAAIFGALYGHAWRLRDALGLDAHERAMTLSHVAVYGLFILVAVLSVVLALALPDPRHAWQFGVPGMVYFAMFLSGPVARFAYVRAHREGSSRS